MTPASKVPPSIVPFGSDPLHAMARHIIEAQRQQLPRLENVTVLLPDSTQASRLRQLLLQEAQEHGGLLGPQVMEWRSWIKSHAIDDRQSIGDYRRELILLQALRGHGDLFGTANLWALTDSLLVLFDELTLNGNELPHNLDEFQQQLASGYGLTRELQPLSREARLVHTLWRAWHEELNERNVHERNARYLLQLNASLANDNTLYLLLPAELHRVEREWIQQASQRGHLVVFAQAQMVDSNFPSSTATPLQQLLTELKAEASEQIVDDYAQLLNTIYSTSHQPLRHRAYEFAKQVPHSPLNDRLEVFSANDNEEQARAIELQVRRWLLDGKTRIGIITENRRLARRLRALLERANVPLQDAAGWALSTTSAAAMLERWLQCVEEDFPHQAMLDLLKSPFMYSTTEREAHLHKVYRLQQDIILHEKISNGIARYRHHLKFRQQRLPEDLAAGLAPVDTLLEQLQQAAQILKTGQNNKNQHCAEQMERLLQSLDVLGLTPQLAKDPAGMRLLEELQNLQQAASNENLSMDWLEFRSWLGRALERYDFKPTDAAQAVSLMSMSQLSYSHFDGLILAAAEADQIPGTAPATPFFNDGVRQELGLATAETYLAQRFYHYRRLLQSAPQILLTYRHQQDGEAIAPSPWLELLLAFHRLAYDSEPMATELAGLLAEPQAQVIVERSPQAQPAHMPRPRLQPSLVPSHYSASAYQQLIDCPYQFFAARGLGLTPQESIREALEKSDYGERVHRCLQAFHAEVKDLPGPFKGEWRMQQRDEAIQLLQQISDAVFAKDLEDNFLHRGWLQRWKTKIPAYIDWQLARAEHWRVTAVEQQIEREPMSTTVGLKGRLDRCDSNGENLAVVDYKTGGYARTQEVLNGESVQLPFYALLAAGGDTPVSQVEYLALDMDKPRSQSVIEGESLTQITHDTSERLIDLDKALREAAELPAWGDDKTCDYCKFSGLCRKDVWRGY